LDVLYCFHVNEDGTASGRQEEAMSIKQPKCVWKTLDTSNAKDIEFAKKFLSKVDQNRKLVQKQVETYFKIILNNDFESHTTGLFMVTVSGLVKQGMHRMTAFLKVAEHLEGTGKYRQIGFWLQTIPEEKSWTSQADTLSFNADATLRCAGIKADDEQKTCKMSGMLKSMLTRGNSSGLGARGITADRLIETGKRYESKFMEICSFFGGKIEKVTIAPVLAAIMRAYVGEPENSAKIRHFCEIVAQKDEPNEDHEKWARRLREHLLSTRTHDANEVLKAYKRTEYALDAFLGKKPFVAEVGTSLPVAKKELFPLPGEPVFSPPSKGKKVDAVLVPLSRSGVAQVRSLDQLFKDKVYVISTDVKYRSLKSGQEIVVFSSKTLKVVARAKVAGHRTMDVDGAERWAYDLENVEQVDRDLCDTLPLLSISQRRVPTREQIASTMLTISRQDVQTILGR
jgi:hypothetical protein